MSSSQEDDHSEPSITPGIKKRRVQRACDICRRKKVRCDGGQMPNNRCSNCITYNHECTYVEAAKKRGPPKGYVESLESRVVTMEKLLTKLCPDSDILQDLGGPFDKDAWISKGLSRTTPSSGPSSRSHTVPPPMLPMDVDDLEPSDNEFNPRQTLEASMKNMNINCTHPRFFGKSSSVMFLHTAIALKREYTGVDTGRTGPEGKKSLLPCKRPEFWRAHPWIIETLEHERPHDNFPPDDLLPVLIDLYFEKCNLFMPLLHRPTLDKAIADGLHYRDEGFGSTVLLVCALGSRFCDDPRVILEGSNSQHSAGWEWFRQVQWIRRSLLAPPRLYDLQVAALTAMFLHGSSTPQASWTVIGIGIRMAQDVGVHRKKTYNTTRSTQEELWKRAFWVLVALDRFISSALGRPCGIHDEDFDVELPVECDDEYWENEDPALAFKQPSNKPSKIAYFNCLIRLNQILAFALRTIYSINKSKVLLGFIGPRWEQHIVSELDSALNKWIDAVPDHLRWDPNREDATFFSQSAAIYASYYSLQIVVHRPFISSPRKPSNLLFPSLAICTNAARSCIHIMDIHFQKMERPSFTNMMSVFGAGIVLLLNIWGGKRAGSVVTDPAKEMSDVHKAMKMLQSLEYRWHIAGRLWDIMYELASVGDLPLPQPSPGPTNKRDRDADNPSRTAQTAEVGQSPPAEMPRHYAGTGRVAGARKARQDQFRSALSSSLSSMHLNGSATAASPPASEPYASSQASADASHAPTYSPNDRPPVSAQPNGYYTAAFASIPPSTASFHTSPVTPLQPDGVQQQAQQPHAAPPAANGQQAGQPLGMDPMFSTQSMMYDQVLSNLSASLMQTPSPPAMQPHDPTAASASATAQYAPNLDDYEGYVASLTGQAYVPDFAADPNALSMWSAAPNGLEWDDWGAYISQFGGMNYAAAGQAGLGGHAVSFGPAAS